ncbi:MAG: Sir2 family NAD-dependent protein deacetylase [Acidimicrobiales bacterium]|nr:Sir2 family NAD-dependent protein deacetylase [Acidimicrobiales bacterium]
MSFHYTSPSEDLSRAKALMAGAGRIVVLTGAGISTDSGIPDFRGPQGVWTKDPAAQRNSHITEYLAHAEVRRRVWQTRLTSPAWTAEPNPGHLAIVDLERQERLHLVATQNIDGLHQRAGNDPALVVELHGTMREAMCLDCDDRGPIEPVLDRLRAGEDDPDCRRCGGVLKSATISFGQSLVVEDLARAHRAALECDLLLAVGSTLTVSPACDLVPVAAGVGAAVVIVNAQPTPYDGLAGAVVRAPISDVLPELVTR